MMAKQDKHAEAMKRFDAAMEADRSNRLDGLDDMRFAAGEQWPTEVKESRRGRPCLTINRMPSFIRQVSNEVRLKPPAIKVLPAEDGDVQTAEVIEGLIRQIEASSKAKRIYSQALEDACRGGMGFFRIVTDYADETSFDQDIFLKPIENPLSVLFDPDMMDPMGRDAKFCFVIETMTPAAFKARYGEKAAGNLDGDNTTRPQTAWDWVSVDKVQVAEYWCVEEVPGKIVMLQSGEVVDVEDYDAAVMAYQAAVQAIPIGPDGMPQGDPPDPPPAPMIGPDGNPRVRDVKRKRVKMYVMSGSGFLGEEYEWPGNRIPIVPVWGEVYRVGDRKIRTSLIRWAKDSQRMMNYWRSASVEALALAPKAPWLVTADQIQGHEEMWRTAGNGNPAVLVYNSSPDGPPQRVPPAPVQGAMLQETALAQDDMKATTGIYDASLGARSNETSGRAIMARQQEGDVSTFAFIDNLLAAVEEAGRIIVDILPRIYDVPRQIRILGKKMEPAIIRVNDGSQFDLTRGKYDVQVETGPSFTTAREKAAEVLSELLQSVPPLAPVLVPRLVEALSLPDGQEIAQEVRQIMQPQQPEGPPEPKPPGLKEQADAMYKQAQTRKLDVETAAMVSNLQGFPGSAYSPQSFPTGAPEGV